MKQFVLLIFVLFFSFTFLFPISAAAIDCCTGSVGCGNYNNNFDDCILYSCNWVCPSVPKCCTGNPGCGNLSNSYENCIDQSCTWTCASPTKVPPISGAPLPTNPPPANVTCTDNNGNSGIQTALGCAPIEGTVLLNVLVRWGVIVGAGIALLLIGFSGFQITTASGDPKKMKAGQELLVSALTGLVLIALAIVLINFLGFTVLKLPI